MLVSVQCTTQRVNLRTRYQVPLWKMYPALHPSVFSPQYIQVFCPHIISKYFVPTLYPSSLSPHCTPVVCPYIISKCFVPTLYPSILPPHYIQVVCPHIIPSSFPSHYIQVVNKGEVLKGLKGRFLFLALIGFVFRPI